MGQEKKTMVGWNYWKTTRSQKTSNTSLKTSKIKKKETKRSLYNS